MNTALMARDTMVSGTKLNYVIPEQLEEALAKYCEQTGRSASDVIRQLLSEYVFEDRKLSTPARPVTSGVRSNMMLPTVTLEALDARIMAEGGTRGGVISRLLSDYLENRLGSIFGETITVNVDRPLYNQLFNRAQKLGKTVEEIMLDACRIYCVGELQNG